jgi:hypothetical protein
VGGDHSAFGPHVIGQTARAQDAKNVSGAQLWDEESLIATARERRSPEEVAFIERLLADVRERGEKFTWGKGATAGVSGWYMVASQPAAVWNVNVSAASQASRAYMYLYFSDLVNRLPTETIERSAEILASIPSLSAKIDEARAAGWKKYPSIFLRDIAGSAASTNAVFDAIGVLTGRL